MTDSTGRGRVERSHLELKVVHNLPAVEHGHGGRCGCRGGRRGRGRFRLHCRVKEEICVAVGGRRARAERVGIAVVDYGRELDLLLVEDGRLLLLLLLLLLILSIIAC